MTLFGIYFYSRDLLPHHLLFLLRFSPTLTSPIKEGVYILSSLADDSDKNIESITFCTSLAHTLHGVVSYLAIAPSRDTQNDLVMEKSIGHGISKSIIKAVKTSTLHVSVQPHSKFK